MTEREFLRGVLAGSKSAPTDEFRISFSELRALLSGLLPEHEDGGEKAFPRSGIVINGGDNLRVRIVDDERKSDVPPCGEPFGPPHPWLDTYGDRVLDLTNLSNPDGGPLPPLIFRNCIIEGVLDISGSHLAGFGLINCRLRALKADGCQIEGDCDLQDLRPVDEEGATCELDDARGLHGGRYCQVRMIAARIDGTLDLRKSRLRSPRLCDWRPIPKASAYLSPDEAANQFALCLAGSEIRGRLLLVEDFEAWGGVSLFQVDIHNSLRIAARILSTHEARELPGVLPDRNFAALNARELKLNGTLFWTQESVSRPRSKGSVYGRVELARSRITGDLSIESCRWEPLRDFKETASIEDVEPSFWPNGGEPYASRWPEDEDASGGIDARYAHVGGQLRIGKVCSIGRRYRPMAGLVNSGDLGPAMDFWKSRIDLGVRIEPKVTLHGALFLNTAHIERHIFVAATFIIATTKRPFNSPFHAALTLNGTHLKGHMTLRIPKCQGRVSMQKLQVDGSIDITALAFEHRSPKPRYGPGGNSKAFPAGSNFIKSKYRRQFDDTSILDMQDLSVTNGINIKLGAVSVAFGKSGTAPRGELAPTPRNRFIVDLRGLSCTSWDDANSACWDRLVDKRSAMTPWRIRFEGINFLRLDNSTQELALRDTAAQEMRTWANQLGDRLHTFTRSHTTLGTHEVKKLRVKALKSFHDNRHWPPRPPWLQRMPKWPGEAGRLIWRWTYEPSWRRREAMPNFSPQPYEAFARAYFAKGDLETGVCVTEARMARQWRKRVRNFTRAWAIVAPLFLLLWLLLLAAGSLGSPTVARSAQSLDWIALLLIGGPPMIFFATTLIFWLGFAYGLRGGRALMSAGLFVIFAAVVTPVFAEGEIVVHKDLGSWLLTEPTDKTALEREKSKLRIAESLLYGADKLIPVLDLKSKLYSLPGDEPEPRFEANVDMTGVSRLKIDTGKPQKKPPPAPHQLRYRAWNAILEVAGWIITSLVVLTLTGVLRRDVER